MHTCIILYTEHILYIIYIMHVYHKQDARYVDSEITELVENYENQGIIWVLAKLSWPLVFK